MTSDLSSEEKIAQRRPIFEAWRDRFKARGPAADARPRTATTAYGEMLLNNAFLLVNSRYNSDQEVFAQAFELVGRDWARALDLFEAAGRSPDPIAYLTDIVNAGNP